MNINRIVIQYVVIKLFKGMKNVMMEIQYLMMVAFNVNINVLTLAKLACLESVNNVKMVLFLMILIIVFQNVGMAL